jgi:hypothetical protein
MTNTSLLLNLPDAYACPPLAQDQRGEYAREHRETANGGNGPSTKVTHETTRNSVAGPVKAFSMIVAMLNNHLRQPSSPTPKASEA